jgi:ribulose-5-phosphate 4-epimerase/fuculose-1-phosphate aldolase
MNEGVRYANLWLQDQNKNKRLMMHKHHGVFAIAPNAAQAFYDCYWLEKAC